jgi:hypothetical protein
MVSFLICRAVQGSRGLPSPCNKGTYSTGGSAGAPGGSCVACATGFTTQETAAESEEDCNSEFLILLFASAWSGFELSEQARCQ